MAQVRLDGDVEELVRDYAEDHDLSLSAAVNQLLREWDGMSFVEAPPIPAPQRALVTSARRRLGR